jgi:hypothetical protein
VPTPTVRGELVSTLEATAVAELEIPVDTTCTGFFYLACYIDGGSGATADPSSITGEGITGYEIIRRSGHGSAHSNSQNSYQEGVYYGPRGGWLIALEGTAEAGDTITITWAVADIGECAIFLIDEEDGVGFGWIGASDSVANNTSWQFQHQKRLDSNNGIRALMNTGGGSDQVFAPPKAKRNQAYVVGDVVQPATPNSHEYRCTTAGTTGGSEPSWNTGSGSTTNDGSVVWTEVGAPPTVLGTWSFNPGVGSGICIAKNGDFDGFKVRTGWTNTWSNHGMMWEVLHAGSPLPAQAYIAPMDNGDDASGNIASLPLDSTFTPAPGDVIVVVVVAERNAGQMAEPSAVQDTQTTPHVYDSPSFGSQQASELIDATHKVWVYSARYASSPAAPIRVSFSWPNAQTAGSTWLIFRLRNTVGNTDTDWAGVIAVDALTGTSIGLDLTGLLTAGSAVLAIAAADSATEDWDNEDGWTPIVEDEQLGHGFETNCLHAVWLDHEQDPTPSFSVAGASRDMAAIAIEILGAASTAVDVSDSGTGSDTAAVAVQVAASDSGTGSDTASVTINVPVSDSAVGSDTALVAVPKAASDSGTGSDTAAITAVNVAVSDSGTGSDVASLPNAPQASDSGTGVDSALVGVQVVASDSGVGSDVASVFAGTLRFASDSGVGSDMAVLTRAFFVVQDSAVGTDTAFVTGPGVTPPAVPSLRIGEVGFAVQSAKGIPAAQPRWAVPLGMPDGHGMFGPTRDAEDLYPANPKMILQRVRRISVPWGREAGIPALPGSIASLVKAMLPDDNSVGTLHTLTPGFTVRWMTFWIRRPGGLYERYSDGLVEGLRFDFRSGEPVDVTVQAQGLMPELLDAEYTPVTREEVRAGFLSYVGADVRLDWSQETHTTFRWEVEQGSIYLSRPASVHKDYRSVNPIHVSRGQTAIEIALTLVFRDHDHYRLSMYGGDLDPNPGPTTVYGSGLIRFVEHWGGSRYLQFEWPAVEWDVPPYDPLARPEEGHVLVEMVGRPVVPAAIGRSGPAVSVTIENAVSGSVP